MPSRRQVLAAMPAAFVGCSSSSPESGSFGPTSTITPAETVTDCRAAPDPPADPSAEESREFVAAAEKSRLHNWLVAQHGGPEECRPAGPGSSSRGANVGAATELDVETARTAVVAETDGGHYVVSTCSASAEYWCWDEGRACATSRKNARFVTHFVGDGRHVRVPSSWFVCHVREDPYAPDPDRTLALPDDEPGLTFQVYPFRGADSSADVTLTDLTGNERVLEKTYSPNVGPAVQSNATVATGEYELAVGTGDDRRTHEFSLSGPDDGPWNRLCVYVGPDETRIVDVTTEGDFAVPAGTCFDRRDDRPRTDERRS